MLPLLFLCVALAVVAATLTGTLTLNYSRGTLGVTNTQVITNAAEVNVDDSVANGTTNGEYDLSWVAARLKFLLIVSDQNITIKTNSTGSPDNTFTISAGVPFLWYTGIGSSCPVTVDVTKLYVTNNSGSAANLQIRSISDPTP